jgi:leucyl-tRNA synthetase
MRFKLTMPKDAAVKDIETAALSSSEAQKWLEGKEPKKVIVVVNKIINVVV